MQKYCANIMYISYFVARQSFKDLSEMRDFCYVEFNLHV